MLHYIEADYVKTGTRLTASTAAQAFPAALDPFQSDRFIFELKGR